MIKEKDLIAKIKELRQIKPDKKWVFLAKERLFQGEENNNVLAQFHKRHSFVNLLSFWRMLHFKPVSLGVLAVLVLVGIFGFAQNSLPGDFFYPFKRAMEKTSILFVSENEKSKVTLDLTQKRLQELEQVAKENKTRNLASAIKEVDTSFSEAADKLSKLDRETLARVVEMSKKTTEIKSKGIVLEEEGLKKLELSSLAAVLQDLINDLENRTLTLKQEMLLDKIKELVNEEKYSEALELYLRNQ